MSEPNKYSDLDVWKALHFGGSTNGWVRWEDYVRLQAEVERLRKAGDAMTGVIGLPVNDVQAKALCHQWNAAKEGKPSV